MSIINTLKALSAVSVLSSMIIIGAKDISNENITENAVRENRDLTQDEIREIETYSPGFYLALCSIPSCTVLWLLDEKRKQNLQNIEE